MYAVLALKGGILIANPTPFTRFPAAEGWSQEMVWPTARKRLGNIHASSECEAPVTTPSPPVVFMSSVSRHANVCGCNSELNQFNLNVMMG